MGCKVSRKDAQGETPLICALRSSGSDVACFLVEGGADVNAVSATGATALQLACHRGLAEVAQLLLRHGADPNAVDRAGNSVLRYAREAPKGAREALVEMVTRSGGRLAEAAAPAHGDLQVPHMVLPPENMW